MNKLYNPLKYFLYILAIALVYLHEDIYVAISFFIICLIIELHYFLTLVQAKYILILKDAIADKFLLELFSLMRNIKSYSFTTRIILQIIANLEQEEQEDQWVERIEEILNNQLNNENDKL